MTGPRHRLHGSVILRPAVLVPKANDHRFPGQHAIPHPAQELRLIRFPPSRCEVALPRSAPCQQRPHGFKLRRLSRRKPRHRHPHFRAVAFALHPQLQPPAVVFHHPLPLLSVSALLWCAPFGPLQGAGSGRRPPAARRRASGRSPLRRCEASPGLRPAALPLCRPLPVIASPALPTTPGRIFPHIRRRSPSPAPGRPTLPPPPPSPAGGRRRGRPCRPAVPRPQ